MYYKSSALTRFDSTILDVWRGHLDLWVPRFMKNNYNNANLSIIAALKQKTLGELTAERVL